MAQENNIRVFCLKGVITADNLLRVGIFLILPQTNNYYLYKYENVSGRTDNQLPNHRQMCATNQQVSYAPETLPDILFYHL